MLTQKESWLINILFATSIIIFFDLGPVSISFPIGLLFLYWFRTRLSFNLRDNHIRYLLILFIGGCVSSIVSPVTFSTDNIVILVQIMYWLFLASAIGELYPYIDKASLSRTIAVCCIALGICNLVFGVSTQNSVAFTIVLLAPLGVTGIPKTIFKTAYIILIFVIMLFNESRTGFAIISVELFLMLIYTYKRKHIKLLLFCTIAILTVFLSSSFLKHQAATIIEPYNEDMALLLTDPDMVNMYDKPWIQRQIQVQKGIQIFEEYPIFGVGPMNFTPMNINIDFTSLSNKIDPVSLEVCMNNSDNRSAHNSYITLLAEFGFVGIVCWIMFIVHYLITMYKKLNNLSYFEFAIFVCSLGVSVYFYTIAGFYGTSTWLLLGLLYGSAKWQKKNQKISMKEN